jgi:uncharacterized protein (TIGR04222 family)
MNPFDLPGPAFLGFYLALGVLVIGAAWFFVNGADTGSPPTLPMGDPYQIAWLRGGTPEAARIAVLSLVDRGLLEIDNGHIKLHSALTNDPQIRRRRLSAHPPLERAILEAADASMPSATAVFTDPAVARACDEYRTRAEGLALVPDAQMRRQRLRIYGLAAALLLGTGAIKVVVALERGRTNIAFLLMLMAIASGVLIALARRRRTTLGDRMMADLRTLFAALRARAATLRAGTMTNDSVLLAAVFGLAALPAAEFAIVRETYKKSTSSSGGGCGSACGSGCGGGDGGGCGGCGSSD